MDTLPEEGDFFEQFVDGFSRTRVAASLEEDGYAVVDNIFPADLASKFQSEVLGAYTQELMSPNQVRFLKVNAGSEEVTVTKPNIFEADLHQQSVRESGAIPTFERFFKVGTVALVQSIKAVGYNNHLVEGSIGCATKLQCNRGHGGCFPLHYDNPGKPNKRQLTCIVYLNPDWKEGHGGELQLVPFLQRPVQVQPLMNRMVIFKSDTVLHRVLPSSAVRCCFTVWIDGNQVNQDKDSTLRLPRNVMAMIPQVAHALSQSALQRLLARAVYEEEFFESLQQCMKGVEGEKETMDSHSHHINIAKANKPLYLFILALREYNREQVNPIPKVV